MIAIDGKACDRKISEFANLEELLTTIMAEDSMANRVITDVLVNGENFTEIYPHQAEDMDCTDISSVEITTIPVMEMAIRMSAELKKVAVMMGKGARSVAKLFREDQQTDALELLQDLLDVTRDFMGLLSLLRDKYLGGADEDFANRLETFSNLVSEMSEVLESEDWVLLADLLEFEFAPICDEWRKTGEDLHKQLENTMKK